MNTNATSKKTVQFTLEHPKWHASSQHLNRRIEASAASCSASLEKKSVLCSISEKEVLLAVVVFLFRYPRSILFHWAVEVLKVTTQFGFWTNRAVFAFPVETVPGSTRKDTLTNNQDLKL